MDKLKQTFSRGKETEVEDTNTPGTTGRVTGQGSHFSSVKPMDRDTLGATAAAQQDAGVGGTATDPTAAQGTGGPEAGGRDHVSTVDPNQLSQGTAAGQTSTYNTHNLARGDPTPSLANPQSTGPTSFKRPESNLAGHEPSSDTGVPPNAAKVAASRAFSGSSHGEGMPGAYPGDGYENPYKAENLDPRVDNLPIRSKEDKTSGFASAAATSATGGSGIAGTSSRPTGVDESRPTVASDRGQDQSSSGFVGKALAAVGLGGAAGAAGYGLSNRDGKDSAVGDTTLPADSTPKPSHGRKESIPTTAYPAGVDSPQAINPPVGGTSQGAQPRRAEEESHTGRNVALGTAGLGAAGAAGYGASQYTDRKEHDPTTFSPASATTLGRDNTSTLRDDLSSQPSGISSGATEHAAPYYEATTTGKESHTGRNVALGTAGLGAAGAAAYGASQHADRRESDPTTYSPASATTLGQDNTSKLRDDLASQPSGISSGAKDRAMPFESSQTTTLGPSSSQREREEDHSKRNAALAAGGVGTGVGAAGAYAATRGHGQNDEPFGHTAIYGPDTTRATGQPYGASGQTATTGHSTTAPIAGQSATSRDQPLRQEHADHTGRNAALAGAAGAGVVGAGAYGAHEASQRAAEEEAAKRAAAAEKDRNAAEKARADQDKAHQKELEKHEKAAAKDEKKHQKDVEKHNKEVEKHNKEVEKQAKKDEKEHEKEVAAMQKQRTREEEQRRKQEEEDEEDRKKKAAAAAAGAGAVGAGGAYAYGKSKDDDASPKSPSSKDETEKEKKPGLFKRIFKRRKNKDTGESEDYSSEEEDNKDDSHKGAVAGAAAGTTALGAGAAYGAHERGHDDTTTSRDIGTAHTTDEPTSRYEAVSGGLQKPSYNPLAKDDPSRFPQTHDDRTGHQAEPLRYDNQRAAGHDTTTSSSFGTHVDRDGRPIEPTTGLPYDPSKDREAAHRLSEHDAAAAAPHTPSSAAGARRTSSGELGDEDYPGSPTSGGSGAKRGFRQKLKEAITGHKPQEEDAAGHQHEDHSVLHKKPHQVPEEVRASTEGR